MSIKALILRAKWLARYFISASILAYALPIKSLKPLEVTGGVYGKRNRTLLSCAAHNVDTT
jgi:hypothetical protein